jgi:GT2 family glycosyltransferase
MDGVVPARALRAIMHSNRTTDKSPTDAEATEVRHREAWQPLVSILLAVRDEQAQICGCLDALAIQDYPAKRIELVVADGGSSDGTPGLVERFVASAPFNVVTVPNPKGSAAAGFNAALREARGEVIVILGSRALPEPNFVSESVRALERSGADAVGGVVIGDAEGFQARAVTLALSSRFGVGDARYRYAAAEGDVDTINYGAYRRGIFAEAGGFDETMDNVEDDEFNYRLRAAGKRLYLSPEIRARYHVRPALYSLARQYARYGYPKVRVLRRHPRQMRPRQFAPAGLVGGLLVTFLLGRRSAVGRWTFWMLLASYLTASAVVSIRLAQRNGWRYLPLLPISFAGMHFGYGAASLAGTVRFLLLPALLRRAEPSDVPSFVWDVDGEGPP